MTDKFIFKFLFRINVHCLMNVCETYHLCVESTYGFTLYYILYGMNHLFKLRINFSQTRIVLI